MATKTEVKIFTMIADIMELLNLALSLTYSTACLYFSKTLPKIAKTIFKNIKKYDFCLDCHRNINSNIKFIVPGNIFNQVARYSGVPWYRLSKLNAPKRVLIGKYCVYFVDVFYKMIWCYFIFSLFLTIKYHFPW